LCPSWYPFPSSHAKRRMSRVIKCWTAYLKVAGAT